MTDISLKNVSFSYYGSLRPIFNQINLSFDTNWKIGLIGRNGIGKTTLLKMLTKELEYTGVISNSTTCYYFPPIIKNHDLTCLEIYRQSSEEEEWKFIRELNLLGLDLSVLDQPLSLLSPGERMKVLLGILFTKEDAFVLIDEPTNHLDSLGRKVVSEYLRQKRQGFMVISHDREFLDGCIDHVLSINRNSIEIQSGNYSTWYQNKLQKDQLEFNENHKLIKEISRLKDASKETKQWSDRIENTKNGHKISGIKPDKGYIGHQSAKMMKKSKNLIKRQEKLIEEKERLLKDLELQETLFLHPLTYPKKEFIKVNHLSFNYGDKNILQDLSFVIKRGDRISINGENGSGKSTLFNCLIGKLEVESSMILKPKDLKISYVPQEIKNLKGSFKEYIRSKEIDETLCRTLLSKLNISKDLLESDIESYSDGQKKKLLLSISLATEAHLYIWDEPMNYIDVISREQIEKVILDNDITLIFVEHDNYFKKKIANKNIEL